MKPAPNPDTQLCAVHSANADRQARCTCPIAPKCPNCSAQEVYRKTDPHDGLPFKACRACGEEWEDAETFAARDALVRTADQQTPLRDWHFHEWKSPRPGVTECYCGKRVSVASMEPFDETTERYTPEEQRLMAQDEASAPITQATHAAELIRQLHSALREGLIRRYEPRAATDLHWECDLCENGTWSQGEPECHADGCLAMPELRESLAGKSTVAPSGRDNVSPDEVTFKWHSSPTPLGVTVYPEAAQQTPLPAERAAKELADAVRAYAPGDDWCPSLRDALAAFDAAIASQAGEREPD